MKKATIEVWVTDELAAEAVEKLTEEKLVEAWDDEDRDAGFLGARIKLPGGQVLRVGQTFG